jgi:cytochrome c-type biogenesis protein CcmH
MNFVPMAVLAIVTIALLTRPWWRRAAIAPQARRAANVAAYKTRLAEIEAEVAGGLADAETSARLRADLDAQLLRDAASVEAPAAREGLGRGTVAALAVGLLVFAAGEYYTQGSWRDAAIIDLAARDPLAAQSVAITGMVAGLEQRLKTQPNDAEGWAMLGRSKAVMKDYAAAADAYAHANQLSAAQPNPDWLTGEGEAYALAHDRDLSGHPRELFDRALSIAPDHARSLWYAGLAAAQAQDYATARERWTALRAQEVPPELAKILDERLQALAEVTGAAPPAPGTRLDVDVSLAPALTKKVPKDAVLYVFAKAGQGPQMPLAVQKIEKATLPLRVTLDDSMSMTPALKLSHFNDWLLTARLSASGDPRGQPGDLEGTAKVERTDLQAPISLIIDKIKP